MDLNREDLAARQLGIGELHGLLVDASGAPFSGTDVSVDAVPNANLAANVYDLAPASSRDLGEEVWAAHLQWGARKAAALRDR